MQIPQEQRNPDSPRKPVSDIYQGVVVVDDYRWLENSRDAEVIAWTERQNRFTEEYLSNLPSRGDIAKRLRELYSNVSGSYYGAQYANGQIFFVKFKPPKQQPFIVAFEAESNLELERVVFDPNIFDPSGQTSIDWFAVSPDSSLIAVCLSKSGSEDGSVYAFKTESGEQIDYVVRRVNYPTGGGSLAWKKNSGFYYTRYPHEGERSKEDLNFYQKVYFHKLGEEPATDKFTIGEDFPRIAEVDLDSSEDSSYFLASVANGDGGEFAHYLLGPSGSWRKISEFDDKATTAKFGKSGDLFLLSKKEYPNGAILRLPLEEPDLSRSKTLIHSREGSIEDYVASPSAIYVNEVAGGPSKIFVYDLNGNFTDEIKLEPLSSVSELRILGDTLLFQTQGFLSPPVWMKYDPATKATRRTEVRINFPETRAYEVRRELATSKDGTKVPLNIIMKKGLVLNGLNPTLLTGYGGYGLSLKPTFNFRRIPFLEQGGIFAIANLRGGGEYGESWHAAGMKTKKQNVFDDFIGCASHLIQRGYTRPDKLAIEGGSNGGLLMGAALVQAPELFKAVISHVGVYDMLRVELHPNGAFNVTEYGTVKEPDEFRALFEYSPYHHVKEGTKYPSVFLTAGENDGRVAAWHSRKMAAVLQRASSSGEPVLLRISSVGHGFGTAFDERVAEDSAIYAFLFERLGVEYRAPA